MLIGNQLQENKIYRGIKHYNSLPLTSRDIHENTDTLYLKNKLLLDQFLGSGTLNEPDLTISSTGVSLVSPSVLLLDGDVSLVQSDNEILTVEDIVFSGVAKGVLCIVGWYQSLNSKSTLRSYGGVRNSVILNDLVDPDLHIQVSTRYQLRWDTVILPQELVTSDEISLTFNLSKRDNTGELLEGEYSITTRDKVGLMRIADRPTSMDYSVSELYIIPLLYYEYDETTGFEDVSPVPSLKLRGSSNTIREYIHVTTLESDITSPMDVEVPIGNLYSHRDLLQVLYNGILLDVGRHYTVDAGLQIVKLKEFVTKVGDEVTVKVIKSESN